MAVQAAMVLLPQHMVAVGEGTAAVVVGMAVRGLMRLLLIHTVCLSPFSTGLSSYPIDAKDTEYSRTRC